MESVNEMNKRKRNPMISIAKAIGIILMVIGHVFDKDSWGIHYIYMFHMPLFFVLSGYFFKIPKSAIDFILFLKKKLWGLYFPYLLWTIFFILLHNLLLKYEIGEEVYSFPMMASCLAKSALTFVTTEKVLVGFWFLKALFSAIIFLAIFGMVTQKFHVNIYQKIGFMFIMVLLLFLFNMPNKTLLGMFYGAIFLCCGRVYRDLGVESKIKGWTWIMILSLSVLLLSRCFSDISNTEMLSIDKSTFLPFTLSGCLGSVLVLMVAKFWGEKEHLKLTDLVRYIGDHSLIILALHYPLIKVFDFYFEKNLGEYSTLQHISGGGNWSNRSNSVISNLRNC